ncbi:MAG: hypothetical protein AB1410_00080 [Acidobacteriota bacterium]
MRKLCKNCGKVIEKGLSGKENFCSEDCRKNYKHDYQKKWIKNKRGKQAKNRPDLASIYRKVQKHRKSNTDKDLSYRQESSRDIISNFGNFENVDSYDSILARLPEGKKLRSETFFDSLKIKKRFSTEIKGIEIFCDKASESVYPITLRKGNIVMTIGFLKTKEQAKLIVETLVNSLEYMKNIWREGKENYELR